jgi:branched-chain amino acid transport system permease protein
MDHLIWNLIINLLDALSYSVLLFLIASGLSLILGLMGILNLAHGSLFMIGTYVGLTLAALGVNFWLAAVLSGIAVMLISLVLERVFLAPLYKQLDSQILLTVGFVYVFGNAVLWIWGPDPKMGATPAFLSASLSIGGFAFPTYRLAIIVIGVLLAAGLYLLQDKTRVGSIVRAGVTDKEMAMGLGINIGIVSTAVFLLGGFLAGAGGYLAAPILGAVPELGITILPPALIVIIVGGSGSVQGALLGAVLIGFASTFGTTFFPDLAMFIIYLAMIIVLLVKPAGVLGRKT